MRERESGRTEPEREQEEKVRGRGRKRKGRVVISGKGERSEQKMVLLDNPHTLTHQTPSLTFSLLSFTLLSCAAHLSIALL